MDQRSRGRRRLPARRRARCDRRRSSQRSRRARTRTISPPVALANDGQLFTLAVPTEKENATTTKIVLTVPDGFSIDSFVAAPGWKRDVQQTGSGENAVIQKVTWTAAGSACRPRRTRSSSSSAQAEHGQDVHVPGRADLLRRLGRRLVRAGELRHAGADGRGEELARRRRQQLDARDRRARRRRRRRRARRRRARRGRREAAARVSAAGADRPGRARRRGGGARCCRLAASAHAYLVQAPCRRRAAS